MAAGQARADDVSHNATVRPGFRERVEAVMAARGREPVLAVRLSDSRMGFDVEGRRVDGTVVGGQYGTAIWRGLGRLAGAGLRVAAYVAAGGGGRVGPFDRPVQVRGPAGALALPAADAIGEARGAWLALTPSRAAVVDTGPTFLDPADAPEPQVVWEAGRHDRPEVHLGKHLVTWPDGSSLEFVPHDPTEARYVRGFHQPPNTIRWPGTP
ncbi:hypothetical protein BJF85_24395 [Saccharomonospora sp. CUA-673]|nr:hypothetical protein BJF85_24395 [Saccharomonospora sp. CUA-673]